MKSFIALAVSIIFTGDILLDRGVRTQIETSGVESLFTPDVDTLLRQADIVVGNLECPATTIHAPIQKLYSFRAEPQWLDALREHGFTHLNLANNHSIDQGRRGLRDTWQNIRQAGMTPVGAGENMAEASRPIQLWPPAPSQPPPEGGGALPNSALASPPPSGGGWEGAEVWLIVSNRLPLENLPYLTDRPCVSQLPIDSLVAQVEQLRRNRPHAVIIVSLHWGAEHTLTPVLQQRHDAHRLVDAGADALICHHTHTLQTIEHYKGRPVYYSIGNFIFDQTAPINTRACIVRLTITPPTDQPPHSLITRHSSLITSETIPITIDHCTPRITKDRIH